MRERESNLYLNTLERSFLFHILLAVIIQNCKCNQIEDLDVYTVRSFHSTISFAYVYK